MSPAIHIYGLVDPRTGAIRYIGQSRAPAQRLRQHLGRQDNPHLATWVAELRAARLQPLVRRLATVASQTDATTVERALIQAHHAAGAELVNITYLPRLRARRRAPLARPSPAGAAPATLRPDSPDVREAVRVLSEGFQAVIQRRFIRERNKKPATSSSSEPAE
jgi:hypothetical protein